MSCGSQAFLRAKQHVKRHTLSDDLARISFLALILVLLLLVSKVILGTLASSPVSHKVNWGANSNSDTKAVLTSHVEAEVSHQQEITTFTDAENEVRVPERGSMISTHSIINNPYPQQTPSHLLSRNFRIGDITWSSASVGYSFDFPEVLFAQTQIADTLNSFLWFAADVEFEVRITSTPYHIGVMQVSYIPCWGGADPGVWQASGNHPVTLSFGTADSATIRIPYVNPLSWLDWATCGSASIARVYLHAVVPLLNTSDSTSDDCPVQIFASFKNVRVAGYLHTVSSERQRRKRSAMITTLSPVDKETLQLRGRGPSRRRTNVDAQMADRIPGAVGIGKKPVRLMGADGSVSEPEKEAEDKSVLGIVGDFSRSGIPILKSIGHFVSGVSSIFKAFSIFDKPNNVTIPNRMMIQHTADMIHGQGLSSAVSLGLSPNTYLSAPGNIEPGETSSMAVCDLARMPMLHAIYQFDNVLNVQTNFVVQPQSFTNSLNQGDWMMALSDQYNYWRGSIKYFFCFYTTPFTTCRFRISINYTTWTADVIPSGDIVSKIVDVKGDTFVEMTIPYLSNTHWTAVKNLIYPGFPRLVVDELVPITGQSVESDPYIFLVTYRSAGEDFQLAQLIHTQPFVSSSANIRKMTGVQAQCDIRQRFSKNFPHIIEGCSQSVEKGFVMSECAGDIGSAIKRMAYLGVVTTNWIDRPDQYGLLTSVPANEPFFQFSRYFLFWRGSRNVKFGTLATWTGVGMASIGAAPTLQSQAGSGIQWQGTNETYPFVDVNVPWYCQLPYYTIQTPNMMIDYISELQPQSATSFYPSGGGALFLGAGDDFQYLWAFPPPPYPSFVGRAAEQSKAVGSNTSRRETETTLSNDFDRPETIHPRVTVKTTQF